jgi:hypothetical protein
VSRVLTLTALVLLAGCGGGEERAFVARLPD